MNAAEGSWRELVEKKRCLQRLCGDLECKVGWKFSGNGGRRDFVDFRRVFGFRLFGSKQQSNVELEEKGREVGEVAWQPRGPSMSQHGATRGQPGNKMGHPDLSVDGSRRFLEVFSEGFWLKVIWF